MAAKPGLSTGHACAPSTDGTYFFFLNSSLLTGFLLSFIKEAISFYLCCIIAVYFSSGDVCTDGLFQCVGVAPR